MQWASTTDGHEILQNDRRVLLTEMLYNRKLRNPFTCRWKSKIRHGDAVYYFLYVLVPSYISIQIISYLHFLPFQCNCVMMNYFFCFWCCCVMLGRLIVLKQYCHIYIILFLPWEVVNQMRRTRINWLKQETNQMNILISFEPCLHILGKKHGEKVW